MAKRKLWAVVWKDGLGVQIAADSRKAAIKFANEVRKVAGAKRSTVKVAQPVIGSCRIG